MSLIKRYATTVNEQADGTVPNSGQRFEFSYLIPGREDAEEKLGASGPSIFNADIDSPEEIETTFKNQLQSVAPSNNPDFIEGVDLNYGKAKVDSLLLKGEATLKNHANVDDKPQYGAPNIRTGDMNDPGATRDKVDLPRRNAGYGSRMPSEDHEHIPSSTREKIGTYFNSNIRRSPSGLGVSHPTRG